MPVQNQIEPAPASSALADERIAVQDLVSRKLGYALRHLGSEDVTRGEDPYRPRRFVKHVFQRIAGDCEPIIVFTKAGVSPAHSSERLQLFLSGLRLAEFRTPIYFGMLDLGPGDPMKNLSVWEYVAKDESLPAAKEWRQGRRSLVLAAAAMTAVTEEVRREAPGLLTTIPFVRPTAEVVRETIENYARRGLDVSSLSDSAAKRAGSEAGALERLNALGGYFTHNDYRPGNVLLKQGDKPVIFDWDYASLGPPGATLRTMARLTEPEQMQVVDLYCAHLAAKGLSVRAPDVMFAMRAVQVFHALTFGGRRSAEDHRWAESRFRWGLDHIDYLTA